MKDQLRAARADASHDRKPLRYTAPALLIIDDLGLRPLTGDEPIDLYEIIRQRYEHGSTIMTSNRDIGEWPPLFGDLLLASAALDRLLHHAHVIEMDATPSETRRRRSAPAPTAWAGLPKGQFGHLLAQIRTRRSSRLPTRDHAASLAALFAASRPAS